MDVLTSEDPDLKNEKLLTLSNTILTPHIAFYSQEAFIQGAEDNFNNLANFLNGKYKEAEIVNASAIEKRYPNDEQLKRNKPLPGRLVFLSLRKRFISFHYRWTSFFSSVLINNATSPSNFEITSSRVKK